MSRACKYHFIVVSHYHTCLSDTLKPMCYLDYKYLDAMDTTREIGKLKNLFLVKISSHDK